MKERQAKLVGRKAHLKAQREGSASRAKHRSSILTQTC